MLPIKVSISVFSLFVSFSLMAQEQIINVAQKQDTQNAREEYLNELLVRALESVNYSGVIRMTPISELQKRKLINLDDNELDMYWSMSSPEREALALAIKIPLFKGYIGKRALLTNKQNLARFKKVKNIEQLATFSAVQGHNWPDTRIMSYNGLHVRPLTNYQAMFTLTSRGRIDYFPRSFIEVNSELVENKQSNLVIVPNLYISYPTGIYYFVTKSKPELAKAVEEGLIVMQESGEFDALFNEYFAKDLNTLPYAKGKTIEIKLDNPYF
ncbi:transporter substrate-binding domain-containing protein [Pseudoalteromonas sp. SWXJ133]|uniref:substrate-binding periplasmic protein n=1 Tax=unclassified Pseudoalteromonas TaxID=194690 RepID=UPI0013FDF689|nr:MULTISPECIES: transporter substrate-binding domain-containing protein [unclassified Pseudoalteromonas]MBH0019231.1 transporter substrate-binding domain-containing protein [Pseudoalteromonas sp. SWXJ133]